MLAFVMAVTAVLVVTDESHHHGRMGSHVERTPVSYELHDGVYANPGASILVSSVDALRSVLVTSEQQQTFDPRAVGITPEWVRALRSQLLDESPIPEFPGFATEVEKLVSYDAVVAEAKRIVDEGFVCTHCTTPEVDVRLNGPRGFAVSSVHDHAMMIPWTVTIDGRTWQTYSLEVSRAVAAVLKTGVNHRLFEEGHLTPGLFVHLDNWRYKVRGLEKALAMPGAAAILARFDITAASSRAGGQWSITLRPKTPTLYDNVELILAESALSGWDPLRRRLEEVERFMSSATWFERASKGRMVRLRFGSMKPFVYPRYGKAVGMGTPDAAIVIEGTDDSRAAIFVGLDGAHVVVGSLRHMPEIDARDFGPDIDASFYLVGTQDAQWKTVSW